MLIDIGSANGLLPDGTKPLPEPMLTYHQVGSVTLTRPIQESLKIPIDEMCFKNTLVNYLHISKKKIIQCIFPHLEITTLKYIHVSEKGNGQFVQLPSHYPNRPIRDLTLNFSGIKLMLPTFQRRIIGTIAGKNVGHFVLSSILWPGAEIGNIPGYLGQYHSCWYPDSLHRKKPPWLCIRSTNWFQPYVSSQCWI